MGIGMWASRWESRRLRIDLLKAGRVLLDDLGASDMGTTTCLKCGAPLGKMQVSCSFCGRQRNSAAPGVRTRRLGSNSGSSQPKLVFALALVLLLALLGMVRGAYRSHQAKRKAEQVEKALKSQPTTNAVPATQRKTPVNPSTSSPPPVSTNAPPKFVQVSGPESERTEGGPEADLVVRTGDINNLGFGWPAGFDPFSGESTPPHPFPWTPPPGSPPPAPSPPSG